MHTPGNKHLNKSLRRACGIVSPDELADELTPYINKRIINAIFVLESEIRIERRDGSCLVIEVPLSGIGYVTSSVQDEPIKNPGYPVFYGSPVELLEQFTYWDGMDFNVWSLL